MPILPSVLAQTIPILKTVNFSRKTVKGMPLLIDIKKAHQDKRKNKHNKNNLCN
jgi:hypothetical protein